MSTTRVNLDDKTAVNDYLAKISHSFISFFNEGRLPSPSAEMTHYFNFLIELSDKNNYVAKAQAPFILFFLILLHAHGLGCEKNLDLAKSCLEKLEKLAGDIKSDQYICQYAKYCLGVLFKFSIPGVVSINLEKAWTLLIETLPTMQGPLKELSRLRDKKVLPSEVCFTIGAIVQKGCKDTQNQPDFKEAALFYKAGIAQSSSECALALSQLYGQGLGVPKDLDKAIEYLVSAVKFAPEGMSGFSALMSLKQLRRQHPTAISPLTALLEIADLQKSEELKNITFYRLNKLTDQYPGARLAMAKIKVEGLYGFKVDLAEALMLLSKTVPSKPDSADAIQQEALAYLTQLTKKHNDLSSETYHRVGCLLKANDELEKALECFEKGSSAECAFEAALIYKSKNDLINLVFNLEKVGERVSTEVPARQQAAKELTKLQKKHPLQSQTPLADYIAVASIRFISKHAEAEKFFDRINLRLEDLAKCAKSAHPNAYSTAYQLARLLEELPAKFKLHPADFYLIAINQTSSLNTQELAMNDLIQLASRDSYAAAILKQVTLSTDQQMRAREAEEVNIARVMNDLEKFPTVLLRKFDMHFPMLRTELDALTSCLPPELAIGMHQSLDFHEKAALRLCRDYTALLSVNLDNYLQKNKLEVTNRQEGIQVLKGSIASMKKISSTQEYLQSIKAVEAMLEKKNSEKKKRTPEVKAFYAEQLAAVSAFLNQSLQPAMDLTPGAARVQRSAEPDVKADDKTMPLPPCLSAVNTTVIQSKLLTSSLPVASGDLTPASGSASNVASTDDFLLFAQPISSTSSICLSNHPVLTVQEARADKIANELFNDLYAPSADETRFLNYYLPLAQARNAATRVQAQDDVEPLMQFEIITAPSKSTAFVEPTPALSQPSDVSLPIFTDSIVAIPVPAATVDACAPTTPRAQKPAADSALSLYSLFPAVPKVDPETEVKSKVQQLA